MAIAVRGQLARMSLGEAIRARLREQILSGELAMGQRLTEQAVADEMGTSASSAPRLSPASPRRAC